MFYSLRRRWWSKLSLFCW